MTEATPPATATGAPGSVARAEALEASASALHGLVLDRATAASALEMAALLAKLSQIPVGVDEEPFRPSPREL